MASQAKIEGYPAAFAPDPCKPECVENPDRFDVVNFLIDLINLFYVFYKKRKCSMKKLFPIIILTLMIKSNTSAMNSPVCENILDVPADALEYILDFLWPQPNPAIPVSYLQGYQNIIALSHTCRAFRQLSLTYTENRIINFLLKFDSLTRTININPLCEVDIAAAGCAFRIISRIRNTVAPSFCELQFQAMMRFFSEENICTTGDNSLTTYLTRVPLYSDEEESAVVLSTHDQDFKKLVQPLIKGLDINARDDDGLTALHRAVLNRQLRYVRLLIAAGADVNIVSTGRRGRHTALYFAVQDASAFYFNIYNSMYTDKSADISKYMHQIVSLLLAAGADPNSDDLPLLEALRYACFDVIFDLLHAGANPNCNCSILILAFIAYMTTEFRHRERFTSEFNKIINILLDFGLNPCREFDKIGKNNTSPMELIEMFLHFNLDTSYIETHRVVRAQDCTNDPDVKQIILAACEKWRANH